MIATRIQSSFCMSASAYGRPSYCPSPATGRHWPRGSQAPTRHCKQLPVFSGVMNNRLLLPLAVLQGLWVLQRTPRLPAPTGRAGRHGNSDGRFLRIVGVGDSIMAGTGVREQCNSLTATFARLLHERSGRGVEWRRAWRERRYVIPRAARTAPAAASADVYLISVGVNDVTRAVDSDAVRQPPARHVRPAAPQSAGVGHFLRRVAADELLPGPAVASEHAAGRNAPVNCR